MIQIRQKYTIGLKVSCQREFMLYPEKESPILEFKKEIPTKQQIVKTIIGFCNLYGGRLVLGVEDNRQIIGIPEEKIDQITESLHRSIYESCTPLIIPSIHTQRIDEKVILFIEVSSGMTKPYYLTSEGMHKGTYCRMGTQTIKATPEMIQELQWQTRGRAPDEMPVYHAHEEEIDKDSVNKFMSNRIQRAREYSADDLSYHYTLLIKEHNRSYPTIGGILLFGKDPQKHLTEAFIICTHFKGVSGREALATRDITGDLFGQYEKALAFVLSQLNHSFVIKGAAKRFEELEIPEEALREMILNAIIHRNYQIPAPTKISIFDDRIEIFSPGNFPGPILPNQLEMGLTFIRNKIIARIFREAGYIEKLGSGFLTLFETYRKKGLKLPVIIEGHGFVKCILPRPSVNEPKQLQVKGQQEMVMQLFYLTDEIRISDVMAHLKISRSSANRILNELVKKEKLLRIGQGAATRYTQKSR